MESNSYRRKMTTVLSKMPQEWVNGKMKQQMTVFRKLIAIIPDEKYFHFW